LTQCSIIDILDCGQIQALFPSIVLAEIDVAARN